MVVEVFVITLVNVIVFFLGYMTGKGKVEEAVEKTVRKYTKKEKLGGVETLSAKEMEKRGTRLEEEEKEMTKLLDTIIRKDK